MWKFIIILLVFTSTISCSTRIIDLKSNEIPIHNIIIESNYLTIHLSSLDLFSHINTKEINSVDDLNDSLLMHYILDEIKFDPLSEDTLLITRIDTGEYSIKFTINGDTVSGNNNNYFNNLLLESLKNGKVKVFYNDPENEVDHLLLKKQFSRYQSGRKRSKYWIITDPKSLETIAYKNVWQKH